MLNATEKELPVKDLEVDISKDLKEHADKQNGVTKRLKYQTKRDSTR